jgi:hypothetical protein
MRFIYVLKDPISEEIRYVGQTNNLERRYSRHLANSLNEKSHEYQTYKSRWIRKIISENSFPIIEIIEECNSYLESNKKEKYYIERFTENGFKLTNSGCSDVTEASKETRKKMSIAKKGKSLESLIGKENAEICRDRVYKMCINNNPNKSWDPKVREKISTTLKEKLKDKENHWAFGKKFTEEAKEKLRISHLNNPKNTGNRTKRSEETRNKIKESLTGKKIKRSEILQIDQEMNLIKTWKSLREIEKNSGMSRGQISLCCKNNNKYAGFFWKYNE